VSGKVVDKSTTTKVDALALSRVWMAVSSVSSKDDNMPALDHSVCIEQYEAGLRLVATDTVRLLVGWVPADGWTPEHEPGPDELPHAVAVAVDENGRARSLLSYMGQQATKEENDGLTALVRLGVPWQAPETAREELQLDGFNALAVDLEYVDNERLQLRVYEGDFPPWRTLLDSFKVVRTGALALSQASLAVLAKAVKPFGEDCEVRLRFGGPNKPVTVEFGGGPFLPFVKGLVMPIRWDFEKNGPAEDGEP
jgi:hypothetical protein